MRVVGWHSGNLFADSLGEDAIELSGGRQSFVLGDAFLLGAGVVNGFGRAAFYLQPRASFDNAAILKLNFSPVRARLFNLENRVDQNLLQGFDQPKTQLFGLDVALFEAGETEAKPKAAGEKQAPTAALAIQTTGDENQAQAISKQKQPACLIDRHRSCGWYGTSCIAPNRLLG
jgi:hypothetical protein